jgi:hypothetical protein
LITYWFFLLSSSLLASSLPHPVTEEWSLSGCPIAPVTVHQSIPDPLSTPQLGAALGDQSPYFHEELQHRTPEAWSKSNKDPESFLGWVLLVALSSCIVLSRGGQLPREQLSADVSSFPVINSTFYIP